MTRPDHDPARPDNHNQRIHWGEKQASYHLWKNDMFANHVYASQTQTNADRPDPIKWPRRVMFEGEERGGGLKGVGRRTKSAIGAINSIIVVGNSRYGSCIFFPRLKKAHLYTCIRTNEKLPRNEDPPIRYQILNTLPRWGASLCQECS